MYDHRFFVVDIIYYRPLACFFLKFSNNLNTGCILQAKMRELWKHSEGSIKNIKQIDCCLHIEP